MAPESLLGDLANGKCMKQTIVTVVLTVYFGLAMGQGVQSLSFGTEQTLDVLTWNIERFPKNGQTSIDYVIEIIEALDADLVALQEIDDDEAFQEVVHGLEGWQGYYDDTYNTGLAYIYKSAEIDVLDVYSIYENVSRQFPREPFVLEFNYRGEYMIAINNHLKCCGNGNLNASDPWDEERRRRDASELLESYIDENFESDRVILLGDLNDLLTDDPDDNAFSAFLNAPGNYMFVDLPIAESSSSEWSYPNWPSHLDHILITNELFDAFALSSAFVQTIKVDAVLNGGFEAYDDDISDHRPVGLRIEVEDATTSTHEVQSNVLQLQISPNPVIGTTSITFKPLPHAGHLEILNAVGHRISYHVLAEGATVFHWDDLNAPPGVYIVRLLINGQVVALKRMLIASN